MSTPGFPHNPLIERRNAATATLNRRRRTAADFAAKLADDRCAFFDRLAVLAAGALTFSVTLLGHPSQPHPLRLMILYAAWLSLLLALGSCLIRNYSNQAHRFYSVGSDMAESEVEVIDADSNAMAALSGSIKYSDSAESFDSQRELRINSENREVWQRELGQRKASAAIHWKINKIAEWTACLGMIVGFLLLICFAVVNTYGG